MMRLRSFLNYRSAIRLQVIQEQYEKVAGANFGNVYTVSARCDGIRCINLALVEDGQAFAHRQFLRGTFAVDAAQRPSRMAPPLAVAFAISLRETLENPAYLRENEPVTAGQDWVDGRQAAWLLGLRAHNSQEADQTGEVSL
jgi:hypothetical protein